MTKETLISIHRVFRLVAIMCTVLISLAKANCLKTDTVKSPANLLGTGKNVPGKITDNLFVTVTASKTKCYVGEPILIVYKLYSNVTATSQITKQPSLNGFTGISMLDNISLAGTTESINDIKFKVHILKKLQVIPLQTGNLLLDPIELKSVVHLGKNTTQFAESKIQLTDLVDQYLKEEAAPPVIRTFTISSKPVTISVNAIPAIIPQDFSGAIGKFSITANILPNKQLRNSFGVLHVVIKGYGNLLLAEPPKIQWPEYMEVLDISSFEVKDSLNFPLQVTKNIRYTFMANKNGNFTIPGVIFTYFDPIKRTYTTIKTTAQNYYTNENSTINNNTTKIKRAGKTGSDKLKTNPNPGHIEPLNILIIVSLSLILSIAIAIGLKRRPFLKRTTKPLSRLNIEGACEIAEIDELDAARHALDSNDSNRFYSELHKAIWNKISNTLNIPICELNKVNIFDQLRSASWDKNTLTSLEALLVECERKIYISLYAEKSDMAEMFRSAEKIMAALKNIYIA